jgi:hypothetical protein
MVPGKDQTRQQECLAASLPRCLVLYSNGIGATIRLPQIGRTRMGRAASRTSASDDFIALRSLSPCLESIASSLSESRLWALRQWMATPIPSVPAPLP